MELKEKELNFLLSPIEDLNLSVRLLNSLKAVKIKDAFGLFEKYQTKDPALFNYCGRKSIDEIEKLFRDRGWDLEKKKLSPELQNHITAQRVLRQQTFNN